jgi:adenine-specific DNA-methyltransferase
MNEVPKPELTQTTSPGSRFREEFFSLFPGLATDGPLDAKNLGDLLQLEISGVKDGKERFGLMWAGKQAAIDALQAPSFASLVPDEGHSVNWDSADNVFVEGDNLEVLKLLQNAYNDKVKLIYIDPPYNTGNDFVYNDDFSDPIKHYLQVTGQVDGEGNRLVANAEVSGRKHSNWLTMMYPRLVLARNLLTSNGVICVSIDDNEVHNLREIMDEIFGAENFVSQLVWQSRPTVQNDTDLSVGHEYILMYARNRRQSNRRLKSTNSDTWHSDPTFAVQPMPTSSNRYRLDDNDGRGPYKEDPFDAPGIRPNLTYGIKSPDGTTEHWPPTGRHWGTGESEFLKLLADGRISFGASGQGRPKKKVYLAEKEGFGEVPTALLLAADVGSAANGTRELQKLFGGRSPFDTPKPTSLLSKILALTTTKDDLVLDFFAGSCSMGQAVLAANASDGGSRRFVLVTLDESVASGSAAEELGFETVSEIGLDRVKRFISQESLSDGLRVFRLGSSAFEVSNEQPPEALNIRESTLTENADAKHIAAQIALLLGETLDETFISVGKDSLEAWVIGRTLIVTGKVSDLSVLDLAKEHRVGSLALVEDRLAGKDDLRSNIFFACKKSNIAFKTF